MSLAQATYRFEAAQLGDLSFEVGDVITVLQKNATGWWTGRTQDGRTGIFPYNRVKMLESPPADLPPAAALAGITPSSPGASAAPAPFIVDRVNRVQVLKPERGGPGEPGSFQIDVSLSNGQIVNGSKTLKDFRMLQNVLQALTAPNGKRATKEGQLQYMVPVPEWAEDVPLEKAQLSQRAGDLRVYLEGVLGDSSVEYALVHWLDPSSNFQLQDNLKRTAQEVFKQTQKAFFDYRPHPVPQLARAAYDWMQRDEQEINLLKGDIIAVLEQNTMYNGWWMGQKVNGKSGLFPYNYVQMLPPDVAERVVNPTKGTPVMSPSSMMPPPPKATVATADVFQTTGNTVPASVTKANTSGRNRKRITKYSLSCVEAFDELLQNGVTIEEGGKLAKFAGRNNTPKKGDLVSVFYSAYIWEPQKQELLEFASSDALLSNDGKITSSPLEFTMGKEEAIEGVEEAVSRMEVGQTVRVTLTPEKGYGDVGFPPDIPGNAYLVYDLTLTDLKKNTESITPNKAGIAKSMVANRKPSGSFKDFKGFKSIQDLNAESQSKIVQQSKRRIQNLGGPTVAGPVTSEAFKKKLTLKQLQEIVRKRQYDEYGIVPTIVEEYLTDDEFRAAFNVDHSTWLLMPAYKRKHLKQELQLF